MPEGASTAAAFQVGRGADFLLRQLRSAQAKRQPTSTRLLVSRFALADLRKFRRLKIQGIRFGSPCRAFDISLERRARLSAVTPPQRIPKPAVFGVGRSQLRRRSAGRNRPCMEP